MHYESDRLFPGSEEPTSDSSEQVSTSRGPASGTTGSAASSPPTSPASLTTPMSETSQMQWQGFDDYNHSLTGEVQCTMRRDQRGLVASLPSTSSSEDSPAKTSASPASAEDSTESAASSPSSSCESLSLFDPVGYSWRTYPDSCQATVDGIWLASSTSWGPVATGGPTGFSMLDTSVSRSVGGESSSAPVEPTLTSILERQPSSRYALSGKAAAGILRRAGRRGMVLPPALEAALKAVAESSEL